MIARPFIFKDPLKAIKLMSLEYQREIPEVKTLNYTIPIKMLPSMHAIGASDFIYHYNGLITESSRSNIFIVKNKKLFTPKSGFLAGVTRKHLIQACKGIIEVEERDLTLKETLNADEVISTSSTQRVLAISQIDARVYNEGSIGPIAKKLQEILLQEEH